VNCFRNFSGTNGLAIRIGLAFHAPSLSLITSCNPLVGRGLALLVASREPAAINRGKAAFQVHKIVGGDQNQGHSGMRLAVKGRDEDPTSCSCCAIASRLAK
jgi:hypothetical protein